MADSDVVHQDVDVAQCLEDLLHTSFEADGIGNIQQIETGTGLCCGLGPEDGIKVAEDYLIALSGKDFNDSFSDSVGTVRNEYASFHGFRIFSRKKSASRPQRQNFVVDFAVDAPGEADSAGDAPAGELLRDFDWCMRFPGSA